MKSSRSNTTSKSSGCRPARQALCRVEADKCGVAARIYGLVPRGPDNAGAHRPVHQAAIDHRGLTRFREPRGCLLHRDILAVSTWWDRHARDRLSFHVRWERGRCAGISTIDVAAGEDATPAHLGASSFRGPPLLPLGPDGRRFDGFAPGSYRVPQRHEVGASLPLQSKGADRPRGPLRIGHGLVRPGCQATDGTSPRDPLVDPRIGPTGGANCVSALHQGDRHSRRAERHGFRLRNPCERHDLKHGLGTTRGTLLGPRISPCWSTATGPTCSRRSPHSASASGRGRGNSTASSTPTS